MKKLFFLPALFATGMMFGQSTVGATWQNINSYVGGILDGGVAVATDGNGNTYTVGTFTSGTTIGSDVLTATGGNGDRDVYVAKYNSSGTPVKAIKLGSSGDDDGFSIAWKADQSGNGHVFVTCYFNTGVNGSGKIYKLDDDATPLTTETYQTLGNEVRARSIYSYGTDRLMVGGSFLATASLPKSSGSIDLTASNINSNDCQSGCYDSFTGILDMSAYFLYAGNPYSSTKDNEIMGICCRNGYIYTTGYFKGDLQWKNGGGTMTAQGVQDLFIASVYMSGSLNQCSFDNDQIQAGSIESQPSGAAGLQPDWKECGYGVSVNGTAIYVTGNLNNASTPLFDGSSYATKGSGAFVARINYSGSQLGAVSWVHGCTNSTGSNITRSIGYGITYDAVGNVFAIGSSYADTYFYDGTNRTVVADGSNTTDRPGFIVKFDASGNLLNLDQINQKTISGMRCDGKGIVASGCNLAATGWVSSASYFEAGALPQIGVSSAACSAFTFGFNREATISNSVYSCTSCAAFPITGTMTVTMPGASAYSWSPTTNLTNTTTATPTYSVTTCTYTATTYTATVTNSVCPTSVAIPFTLVTVPQTAANAGADHTVCPNVPYTMGTAAIPGYTYVWSPITNLGSTYNQAQPTYSNTAHLGSPRTYQVTATDACGNVTVDYVVLSDGACRLANPDGASQTAEVFPNPSTGVFTVNLATEDNESTVDFVVTDLTGRTIQQTNVTTAGGPVTIDLSGQAKGVYMLSVTRNGVTEVHQLVIE